MFYGDTIGLDKVLAGMRKYGEQLGEPFGPVHWAPSALLERLVAQGRGIADWTR
jgi:3-hydroxyacyl-CoA dehydrogenase